MATDHVDSILARPSQNPQSQPRSDSIRFQIRRGDRTVSEASTADNLIRRLEALDYVAQLQEIQ